MDQQERKDVTELCKSVINMSLRRHYNSNGPDYAECPMCLEETDIDKEIEDIKHKADCGYLIAKDLLTNIK